MRKKRMRIKLPGLAESPLSGGEIHYLWWFIQGSIMVPHIRYSLRKAWGFCERHAWGAILVEASFRNGYMHGPAILYEDLLRPAIPALSFKGPFKNLRLWKNLREKGPCMMCEMDYGPGTQGAASADLVERGRDPRELQVFAQRTESYWGKTVCGRCLGNGSWPRCRRHLIEDASKGAIGTLLPHQDLLNYIFHQITLYSRSFRWEYQGTETEEDEAALISAVGWCSGWQAFFSILGVK